MRSLGEEADDGECQADEEAQKVHQVKNTQFSFFKTSQRGLISNIPDIVLEMQDFLYSLIHGIRALDFAAF